MPSFIFLIGMPGCGKSTIASKLGAKLSAQVFDLDKLIETQEGMRISQIFTLKGEEYFRLKESEILKASIKSSNESCLIACGGGTPCFNNNMDLMLEKGICIYLEAGVDFLYSRIIQSNDRPMFEGINEDEKKIKLSTLLKQREVFYKRSQIIVQALNLNIEGLVSEIKNHPLYRQ